MRFRIFALGLLLAGAAASCIREDMSQCRNAHELVLSYLGDGKTEIFDDKICRVEMYVFDAMNSCVADFVVPAGQVAARTAELPPLAPGDYRVVCLGNTHHTKTVNLSAGSFDAIRFADADYVDTGAASGNDSLYYASVPVTVTGFTGKEGDRTTLVPFVCSHYDLSVEVAGIPRSDVRAGLLPRLEICGVAPCTDFENRVCGEAADYTLETRYDADKMLLTSETNIMRHTNHEAVSVCLRTASGESTFVEVNLAEFLAEHPGIDCSKQEVLIPIRIEFTSAGVEVSVPDWFVQEVKPEF